MTPKRPGPARNRVSWDTQEHLAHHIPRCTSKGWCFGHGTGSCQQLLSDTSSAVLGEEGWQGATASAAPTQQAPGPRVMLVHGRNTFSPALPHGHMLAGHNWHQVPVLGVPHLAAGLWVGTAASQVGAKGRPSTLGWMKEQHYWTSGNRPCAMGLSWLQQGELLGSASLPAKTLTRTDFTCLTPHQHRGSCAGTGQHIHPPAPAWPLPC